MAYVSTTKNSQVTFADRFGALFAGFGRGVQEYRLYRRTRGELSAMSDRDLADIGLSRFQIEEVARQAVYGK